MKLEELSEGANYSRYIPSSFINLEEATALSLGKNPEITTWKTLEKIINSLSADSFKESFRRRNREIRNAYTRGQFCAVPVGVFSSINGGVTLSYGRVKIPLNNFYLWGKEKNYEFDPLFVKHMDGKLSLTGWRKQ